MPELPNLSQDIERSVHYYRIYQMHSQGAVLPADEIWEAGFGSFFRSGVAVKIHDVKYQLHSGYENLVVLSMHRRIDLTFATQEDEAEGTYKPVTDEEKESQRLANASVAVVGVYNNNLYVAITKGGHAGSPGLKDFQAVLAGALPLPANSKWRVDGVMHPSDRDKLRSSSGVTSISGTVVTKPTTDEIDGFEYGGPIEALARAIADYVNTGVEITFSVKLEDHGREHTAKAKDMALKTNFATDKNRRPKVTAQSMSGEELLTLVRHQFASKIYLGINDIIGANFSVLLNKSAENFRLNISQAIGEGR